MDVFIIILLMVCVGFLVAWLARTVLWKDKRKNDVPVAITAAVITGLLDWYVIDAMGMSQSLRYLGVALEPPLVALGLLWLLRYADKRR